MTGKDFTDEVLASKYLNACILESRTKSSLRIWAVDHKPELAMPIQEIYDMVKSYKNKPTIAHPTEPFCYRYIAKKKSYWRFSVRECRMNKPLIQTFIYLDRYVTLRGNPQEIRYND